MPPFDENRPDPDQLLRQIQAQESRGNSGQLKVFLGYASGVGKSIRMLREGLRRKQRGEDVIIGALQPNPDPRQEQLLGQFEIIPPLQRKNEEAMDLHALLTRRPEVCLIDGLAQDNPSWCHNKKRYQDVEELRNAGITIITAVNLQHIEEIRPQVEPITGKKTPETIPKQFLLSANEIEIIDIPPEQLFERVGKQPDETSSNLERTKFSELREVALLLAAEVVDHQLQNYLETSGLNQPIFTQERVMVCITPRADARTMILAGRQTAERFHGDLFVIFIQQPNLSEADQSAVSRQLDYAREAGAQVRLLPEQEPVPAILHFARENRITQLFIGRSLGERWWHRIFGNRVDRLLRSSRGMDVCIFPH